MERTQSKHTKNKRAGDPLSCEESAAKRQKNAPKSGATGGSEVSCTSCTVETVCKASGMFEGMKIFILETGIGKTRRELFGKQIVKNGGSYVNNFENSVTHMIVDEKMELERLLKILKMVSIPETISVIKSTWISSCLKVKKLISTDSHKLECRTMPKTSEETTQIVKEKSRPVAESKTANVKEEYQFKFSTGFEEEKKGSDSNAKKGENESTFDKLLQIADFESDNDAHSDSDSEKAAPLPKVEVEVQGKQNPSAMPRGSDPDSDYVPSGDEEEPVASGSDATPGTSPLKNFPTGNWICSMSSKRPNINHNEHITSKLEQMATLYQNTNDRWRAFGYTKAVAALKRHPKPITTWEEAKALPGVGAKLADKIWEIAESGELRKLNELSSREDVTNLSLFMNVWGAGPTTARQWLQMGLKSLDDLREKANLTKQQKIGLAHYHDFLERMPREEAGEIEAVVIAACHDLDPGLIAQACGSYRRGKATCGDVDVLVTHPDGKSHKGVFSKLLTKLKEQGFLTDDLVSHEETGNQKKYLGVCKLSGENRKYRRIDIIVVPYAEYACALVYFTGSAHFNRSLRHLAKKNNMSLNEHALCVGVVRRGGEKIHRGTPVSTPTEEAVFKAFGLKYRPPEERDH